jgi:hypothetical protein
VVLQKEKKLRKVILNTVDLVIIHINHALEIIVPEDDPDASDDKEGVSIPIGAGCVSTQVEAEDLIDL